MTGNYGSDSVEWVQITCEEREALIDEVGRSYNGPAKPYGVLAGRSDLDGQYGRPCVFTEWGHSETGVPLLQDYRWPESTRPCEHYRAGAS